MILLRANPSLGLNWQEPESEGSLPGELFPMILSTHLSSFWYHTHKPPVFSFPARIPRISCAQCMLWLDQCVTLICTKELQKYSFHPYWNTGWYFTFSDSIKNYPVRLEPVKHTAHNQDVRMGLCVAVTAVPLLMYFHLLLCPLFLQKCM